MTKIVGLDRYLRRHPVPGVLATRTVIRHLETLTTDLLPAISTTDSDRQETTLTADVTPCHLHRYLSPEIVHMIATGTVMGLRHLLQ